MRPIPRGSCVRKLLGKLTEVGLECSFQCVWLTRDFLCRTLVKLAIRVGSSQALLKLFQLRDHFNARQDVPADSETHANKAHVSQYLKLKFFMANRTSTAKKEIYIQNYASTTTFV